jgi:hypothetical protein
MKYKAITAALVLAYAFGAYAADDDTYKIHVYSWSYGRERKTITSSNRVTANFMIKNVTKENLNDVTLTLTYNAGLGEKIDKQPPQKKIGPLKAGEAQKVQIVGDFIPVFGGYDIVVEYNGNKKEEWNSTQDVGQPNPKNGEPLHGVANVVVVGKELVPDRNAFRGSVHVKNEGTVEAKNLKFTVIWFDAKKQKIGDFSGKLGNGTLAGGGDETIPFSVAKFPRNYSGYEINALCDDTSAETALSGGEFTTAEEVEFAKITFKRPDPKSSDLIVSAQVRNGFKSPVDQVKLTVIFMNAKKKELKRHTYELPGQLNGGEIKPVEFTVKDLVSYEAFEQAVNYNKVTGEPASNKPTATKIAAASFQNLKDVEVIFTGSETNDDKSVLLAGAMRNGKSNPVKDVAIQVTFTKADGSTLITAEKTLTDVSKPGEERNFVLKAPNAAGFASYSFKFKYTELKDGTSNTAAKVDEAETTTK